MDNTHDRTTSGVACHYSPWTANRVERHQAWHAIIAFKLADTVRRRRAWHAIIALGRQTPSNDVGGGMPSPLLVSTHSRTTSGVACHHRLWAAHTVGRRRALHAIIALGEHRRSDDVGRGMPSSPLDSTDGRATSSVSCHHRPWAGHTVGRCRTWHAIIALGQHRRSDDVVLGMPSSSLDSTDGRPSSGVACHHRPWTAQTVERRRACHAIIALGQHTRSDGVEHGMPS